MAAERGLGGKTMHVVEDARELCLVWLWGAQEWTKALVEQGRFQPITIKGLRDLGARTTGGVQEVLVQKRTCAP